MKSLPRCTIGFVYNEPCPLKCDFCCHTKENVGPGRLSPANVIPVLLGYARHKDVSRFAFTGGDPFIYIKEIITIMSEARRRKVTQPFHIVTSGYWAKSDDVVRPRLEQLASLGMDMLYVSYDLEHRRWVPENYVYRIERWCEEFGVTLSVYGIFWEPGTTVRDLLPDLRTHHVNENLVAPIGRAKDQSDRIYKGCSDASKSSCGRPLDYDITIYPNGDTYPCCSGGFNKEGGLLLGNSFEDPPEAIIRECYSHFFVTIAKELGFDKLFEAIKAHGLSRPDLPQFSDVASVCDICSKIHGNRSLMEELTPALQEMEVNYCIARLDAIDAARDEREAATKGG